MHSCTIYTGVPYCTIYTGVPYCRSPWRAMEHGANATELFAFVGGDRYGPPATTVRGKGYSRPLRPSRHHGKG